METILPITEGELIRLFDEKEILLLIDGDTMAHIACKDIWTWLQKKRGIKEGDDNWTKYPPKEGYTVTEAESIAYFRVCTSAFNHHLKSTCERLFTESWLMAVKGNSNYRDDMYPDYKITRKNKPNQNHFVQILRDSVVEKDIALTAEWREADDYLRIWAEECKRLGIDYVICREDKDLKCIPGKHFNIKTNEFEVITEEYALRFYYQQLLSGDPTDSIPGLPGVGPIKAVERLAPYSTEEEFQDVVVEGYLNQYGDEWEDYLLSNGKMIYIQKHMNDFFEIKDWSIVKSLRAMKREAKTKPSEVAPVPKFTLDGIKEVPESIAPESKPKLFANFKAPVSPR